MTSSNTQDSTKILNTALAGMAEHTQDLAFFNKNAGNDISKPRFSTPGPAALANLQVDSVAKEPQFEHLLEAQDVLETFDQNLHLLPHLIYGVDAMGQWCIKAKLSGPMPYAADANTTEVDLELVEFCRQYAMATTLGMPMPDMCSTWSVVDHAKVDPKFDQMVLMARRHYDLQMAQAAAPYMAEKKKFRVKQNGSYIRVTPKAIMQSYGTFAVAEKDRLAMRGCVNYLAKCACPYKVLNDTVMSYMTFTDEFFLWAVQSEVAKQLNQ